ncbi:MAG: PIN domain-containing protein [Alphaproteobacteria bacterium]|nr:PIN domain-containing protein [Alphaproteobacteria bacterium]
MMAEFTVVLDANVLYGQRIRSLLMELAVSDMFRPRWTQEIHREWMVAVSERTGIKVERLERTRRAMDAAAPDALVTGYEHFIPLLSLPDPDDRHVLAAAIRAKASAIVTFNVQREGFSCRRTPEIRDFYPPPR